MKTFSGKNIEDVLQQASEQLNIAINDLNYEIIEEKKRIFGKKVTINVFELADVVSFAEQYLINAIATFGITATTKSSLKEDIINVALNTDHNSILIGKNGQTLQALNELARVVVNHKFKKRYRILLDINEYKDNKYDKIVATAKRVAKEVQKTRVDVALDSMPADERRVIHTALANMRNIKTESVGEGRHRAIKIKYIE